VCGSAKLTLSSGGDIVLDGGKITLNASGDVIVKSATIKEN
jgi:uncharacterized protein (DUF2345 family)